MKLLGDLVKDVISDLGLAPKKPCAPCEERRQKMNEADRKLREKLRRRGK